MRVLCKVLGWMMVVAIGFYRFAVRPYLVGSCPYCPTCSEYAAESILTHGPFRGCWLAVRRLVRCTPFAAGGFDPVPSRDG